MPTEVLTAIISGAVTLITSLSASILVFKSNTKQIEASQKKSQEEQIQKQNEKIEQFSNSLNETLEEHKETYIKEINSICNAVAEVKATQQNSAALMELRFEHMTKQFEDMKVEVREHNNFARRMPVVEEQIKVANHRIEDLEKKVN